MTKGRQYNNAGFFRETFPIEKLLINPSVTARVKISQNVDILDKVYIVLFMVKHCQTLRVVNYIYMSKWVDHF